MTHLKRLDKEELVDKLMEEIEGLKAELDKHRWIPVSERLPENEGVYQIIKKHSPYPASTEYDKQNGWETLDVVTHWKPIILPNQALKETK